MSEFGRDPAKDFAEDPALQHVKPTAEEIARDRHHYARLASRIHHAHALNTHHGDRIGREPFADEDKRRVVQALLWAGR